MDGEQTYPVYQMPHPVSHRIQQPGPVEDTRIGAGQDHSQHDVDHGAQASAGHNVRQTRLSCLVAHQTGQQQFTQIHPLDEQGADGGQDTADSDGQERAYFEPGQKEHGGGWKKCHPAQLKAAL